MSMLYEKVIVYAAKTAKKNECTEQWWCLKIVADLLNTYSRLHKIMLKTYLKFFELRAQIVHNISETDSEGKRLLQKWSVVAKHCICMESIQADFLDW